MFIYPEAVYLQIQIITERVWMVQTEQQYICIHQCLLAVLEGQENTAPPREIHDNQGYEGSLKIKTLRDIFLEFTKKPDEVR